MRHSKGFTLLELMIVVAIVAILAAVVVPSYADYMRRSRITEAVSVLSGMRVKMEQYFQDNRTYTGACTGGVAPAPQPTANFSFACSGLGDASYVITATGINSMVGFTYTINQANVQTTVAVPAAAGWAGTGKTCWVLRKDGAC